MSGLPSFLLLSLGSIFGALAFAITSMDSPYVTFCMLTIAYDSKPCIDELPTQPLQSAIPVFSLSIVVKKPGPAEWE